MSCPGEFEKLISRAFVFRRSSLASIKKGLTLEIHISSVTKASNLLSSTSTRQLARCFMSCPTRIFCLLFFFFREANAEVVYIDELELKILSVLI